MNLSKKNTLIVGWNEISQLFVEKRLDHSEKYSIIDLEKKIIKNNQLKYLTELDIEKINSDVRYIFYFFEKFDKKILLKLNDICIEKNIKLFIGSNKKSIESKHFLDLRNIERLFHKTPFYRKFILRFFDLIVSLIACIFILPIFFVISIIIFIDDGFPIFFYQKRIGLRNKKFDIYKFRSMYNSVEKYDISPSKQYDKRITKIGNFLRKTSLDELPQFFNVLKGDMSIVGPRPEMPFIVEEYNEFERFRLKIKPGITGAWQVSPTRNSPIHYNVDYDIYQIINNSLRYNIKQILKTIIWAGKGL
ncbi:MAG: sugar transferase [Candidatus Neomarinimicrobiota bacterium]|nr:sugar transferase [Candidatus Neomarinimicrobiota bacterium]